MSDQNFIQEEIKNRLKPGNACYHSVQNLLSSRLLSKIKIYRTIILLVVLYGCETWSLIEGGTQDEGLRIGCREKYLDLRGTR